MKKTVKLYLGFDGAFVLSSVPLKLECDVAAGGNLYLSTKAKAGVQTYKRTRHLCSLPSDSIGTKSSR